MEGTTNLPRSKVISNANTKRASILRKQVCVKEEIAKRKIHKEQQVIQFVIRYFGRMQKLIGKQVVRPRGKNLGTDTRIQGCRPRKVKDFIGGELLL